MYIRLDRPRRKFLLKRGGWGNFFKGGIPKRGGIKNKGGIRPLSELCIYYNFENIDMGLVEILGQNIEISGKKSPIPVTQFGEGSDPPFISDPPF